jgi:hypothetical protein
MRHHAVRLGRFRRATAGVALFLSVTVVASGEASEVRASDRNGTEEAVAHYYVSRGSNDVDGGRLTQVLVRTLDDNSAVQIDVAVEESTISYITVTGADGRAICEAVFSSQSSWFGWCDVYDYRFDSFEEWLENRPDCGDCIDIFRYVFSANSDGCGAVPLGDVRDLPDTRDLAVLAALEISDWDSDEVAALADSLVLIGSRGCPRLSKELLKFSSINQGPLINENDLIVVSEIPDEIRSLLKHEQVGGLVDWLETLANRLP